MNRHLAERINPTSIRATLDVHCAICHGPGKFEDVGPSLNPIGAFPPPIGPHGKHPTVPPETSSDYAPPRSDFVGPFDPPAQVSSTDRRTTHTLALPPVAIPSPLEPVHKCDTHHSHRAHSSKGLSVPNAHSYLVEGPWQPGAARPTCTDAILRHPTT